MLKRDRSGSTEISTEEDNDIAAVSFTMSAVQVKTPEKIKPYLRGFFETIDPEHRDNLFHLTTSFPLSWADRCEKLQSMLSTIDESKVNPRKYFSKVKKNELEDNLYNIMFAHQSIYGLTVDQDGASFARTAVPAYHIGQTAIYEHINQIKIHDKCHITKSKVLLNSLTNLIERLELLMTAVAEDSKVSKTLYEFKAYLAWHVKLLIEILYITAKNNFKLEKNHSRIAKELDVNVLALFHPSKPLQETPGGALTTPLRTILHSHRSRTLKKYSSSGLKDAVSLKLFTSPQPSPTKKPKPSP